jgi:endonuclease/exonuclease/phosphatase family metal-dependent hydrolase
VLTEYHIAWWNLENLFDVMAWDQRKRKVRNNTLKSDLKDWDEPTLTKKLEQLAEVIATMNSGAGPDILGVCEVENENVLQKLVDKVKAGPLVARNYKIVYHESDDPRGIDVAFVYDAGLFGFHIKDPNAPPDSDASKYAFSHTVLKRSATRDILQVNFSPIGRDDRPLVLIANHWPARTAGTYDSEPYRIIAAETLSYWHLRIRQELGDLTAILAMGDFNDGPGNRSLTDYALSSRNRLKVIKAGEEKPRFLNCMWPLMSEGYGSYYHENRPYFFDQFLASEGLIHKNGKFSVSRESVEVIRPSKMQMGQYKTPRRFGLTMKTKSGAIKAKLGYSDHYPISIKITMKP